MLHGVYPWQLGDISVDRIPLRPGLLSPYVQPDCSRNLQSCLGSYNRSYFDGALFDSKGVIAECAGGRPNTAPQAVCVKKKMFVLK